MTKHHVVVHTHIHVNICILEAESCFVAQAGFQVPTFQPLPPNCTITLPHRQLLFVNYTTNKTGIGKVPGFVPLWGRVGGAERLCGLDQMTCGPLDKPILTWERQQLQPGKGLGRSRVRTT